MMRLDALLDRRPQRLSGGEQQRVALARALVRRPRAFLMDEPLTNLDAELRADMRTEIKHLQAELGTTMVYVTHDQVEAMSLGHRIAILNKGRVEQVGTPLEVYDRPASLFCAAFIGSPPMNLIDVEMADGALRGPGGLVLTPPAGPAARPLPGRRGPAGGAGGHAAGSGRLGARAGRLGRGARGRDHLRARQRWDAQRARPDAPHRPLRRGGTGRPAALRRDPARLRRRTRKSWWPDGNGGSTRAAEVLRRGRGAQGRRPGRAGRVVLRRAGSVRSRQDDDAAGHRRAREARRRLGAPRREGRDGGHSCRPRPGDGLPELCALPAAARRSRTSPRRCARAARRRARSRQPSTRWRTSCTSSACCSASRPRCRAASSSESRWRVRWSGAHGRS